jgi:DNA repair protein RadD
MTAQLTIFPGVSIIIPTDAPELRGYQARAIDEVQALVRRGVRRILFVLPTGAGKTAVATSMIRDVVSDGCTCLFVAHRIELIDQCAMSLMRWGVVHVGVIRADDARRDASAPVQVASLDTLRHRAKPPAQLIFIDEAHRAMAAGYREHIFAAYPDAIIVGLTATPVRSDNQGLGEVFEEMVVGASYAELIAAGSIVAPRIFMAEQGPVLTDVKIQAGDYAPGMLERAMSEPKLVGNAVEEWRARAEGRATLLFASGVNHSKEIVARFRENGVKAVHVDGTTPDEERKAAFVALATGDVQVLSNFGIATEGTDIPACKCVMLLRPTKSLALFMQMCGRAMRPHGELSPLILDHAGCTDEHGLPHEDRVWHLSKGLKEKSPGVRTCTKCFAVMPSTAKVCTECGFVWPVGEGRSAPTEIAGKLVERAPANDQRVFWDREVDKARTLGFKPGFPAFKFKEKFEKWPPWDWSQVVKADFANDSEWQARVDERTARREKFAPASQAYKPTATPSAPTFQQPDDEEIPF